MALGQRTETSTLFRQTYATKPNNSSLIAFQP